PVGAWWLGVRCARRVESRRCEDVRPFRRGATLGPMALSLPRLRFLQLLALSVCAVGVAGLLGYIDNFWLYRGYPAPREPAYVKTRGHTEVIRVKSDALGGRVQRVYVYLPPNYDAARTRRYPVLYLLHGVPGLPQVFLRIVRAGIIDDELVAQRR